MPVASRADFFPIVQTGRGDRAVKAYIGSAVRELPRIGVRVFVDTPGQHVSVPNAASLPDHHDGRKELGDGGRVADGPPHRVPAHREEAA
ncbi:hypothetical protein ACFWAY_22385 [Rhodococcus sp. NPDC059968]|uniref:hypothetical protein n=1 Tax=Rhodococcus sp. NPDC059968 TaxID=3347017 RepID=UPI00366CEB52